jgi:hypothetical protein
MKAITAILFTVLYTIFSCFASTGFAASTCNNNTGKSAFFSYIERGKLNTDNSHDNCTHKPAVTAHVIQKQTNNLGSGGNKCLLLFRLVFHKFINSNLEANTSNELCSKAIASPSCPLFIKHCVLLI